MLLERESELDAIDALLARVRDGRGGVVVFEGPPGIGKTALLSALSERAAERDVQVLGARASQLDRGFSFGVARQLLERRVSGAGVEEREVLLADAAQRALPALGIAGGDEEGNADQKSLHGLYWLTANLSSRGPLVLCLDDAHWADRSSLQWLLYTARRLGELPLGLIVATRANEPGAEQDLLDELALDDVARLVKPRPLSSDAVGVLVDAGLEGSVDDAFSQACHHSTGGNPLLLDELLRQLATEGATPSARRATDLQGFGVEAVARSVRHRLRGLGPQAEAVAHAVAVIGDGATVAEAAVLCELDEDAVRATAVELAATHVLLAESPLGFVHPLVAAAVYEDMAAVQRAALHRQVAELRAGVEDPEQVAIHLLYAEPGSDPRVVNVLRAAAAQATERGAPDAAMRFLRRALAEPPAESDRATVLVELGMAEAGVRAEGFEQRLREGITALSDPQRATEVALALGHALASLGDGNGAYDVFESTLEETVSGDAMAPALKAELLLTAHTYPQLRERGRARARETIERIERGEQLDPAVLGGIAPWLLGSHPPAARAAEAAEAALDDARLTGHMSGTGIQLLAVYTLLGAGHLDRGAAAMDDLITTIRRQGDLSVMGAASMICSEAFFRQGEIVKAEDEGWIAWENAIGEGMAMAASEAGMVFAGGVLVNALVARGKLAEAERCTELMPDPLPARGETFLPARAELRLAQGRVDEAIADLRATGELLGEQFDKPVQNWRARLAVTLAGVGEQGEARALTAAELEQARRWQAPIAIGVALSACGVVTGGDEGIALLEEAVTTLEPTAARLDQALALIELGALMRREGSRKAAREPLRLGMDLAARCGADAHADRAHAELVAAGARPRRDRRFMTGPESLTASEMRVAALAAEGLTDRAIAQQLYVTQSAVQFHLRNVFRKLEISARGDLATALAPG